MRTALLLVAALLIVGVLDAVAIAAEPARAIAGELDQARALVEQAQPHIEVAMNPENKPGDRKKARKQAYPLLKKARGLFDTYLDAHPGEVEALDSEYCGVSANLYWIKKFATINEFRGDDPPVELPPARSSETEGAGDSGGIGGASRPDEPAPGEEPPKPGPDEPPPPAKDEPSVPVPDPAAARAEEARAVFDALQDEEARRPGDVAHLHALYEKFLVEYDDPALRVYQRAALRLGALTDRMKAILKEESGFDPDDFDVKDSAEVTRVVKRLSDMLKTGDASARHKASELLGKLATGAAGYPLAKVLFDKDDVVAKNASDGLVAIGGKRVATNLTKLYRDGDADEQFGALDVLIRICKSGDVDARSVSHAIGRFVLSNDERVSDTALESLAGLGGNGVPGLLEALSTRSTEKRVDVIRALGDTGYVDATPRVAMYLLPGSTDRSRTQREAAMYAIEKFGMRAVPYLIKALKDAKRKVIVRDALTMLTGQRFSAARPGDWQKWWKQVGSKQVDDG